MRLALTDDQLDAAKLAFKSGLTHFPLDHTYTTLAAVKCLKKALKGCEVNDYPWSNASPGIDWFAPAV